MSWTRSGKISVTNGQVVVTGTGTNWITTAGAGEALQGPDGRYYEIANIASNTEMTLGSPYLGATQAAQDYAIMPSQSYIRDLAAQAAVLVNEFSDVVANLGTLAAQDANAVDVTGGAIDGVVIGGRVPGAVNATTLSATSLAVLSGIGSGGQIHSSGSFLASAGAPVYFGNPADQSVAALYSPSPSRLKAQVAYYDGFELSPNGLAVSGFVKNGYFRKGVYGFTLSESPLGFSLLTNIPYEENAFFAIRVYGYNYRNGVVADLTVCGYCYYGHGVINKSVSSAGAWLPSVTFFNNNGKLEIHFGGDDSDCYFLQCTVDLTSINITDDQASGWLVVKKASPGGDLISCVNKFGAIYSSGIASLAAGNCLVLANGNVQNTNNSYGGISDVKLKERITDTSPKLPKMMLVRIVDYYLKSQPGQKLCGVIAQELEEFWPGLVEQSPDCEEVEISPARTEIKITKRQVVEYRDDVRYEIAEIDGKWIKLPIRTTVEVPLFTEHLLYAEDGSSVMECIQPATDAVVDEQGEVVTPAKSAVWQQAIHRVPVTEDISEEVEIPAVTELRPSGTVTKSVKYSVFVPLLIKAMQEQQVIIDGQGACISDISARLAALEAA